MNKNLVVYCLEITDWSGCIGGEHLTAQIKYDDENGEYKVIELERKIGLKEAKYLAEKCGLGEWARPYERVTNKFNNEKEVEKIAKKICEELGKNHDNWILIHNDILNPNVPVAGKGKIVDMFPIMEKLALDWTQIPNHKRTDDLMDTVGMAWNALVNYYKK